MSKTIKEMAVETFPDMINFDSHCKNLLKRDCFIVGANAVLKKIEFAMSLSSGSEHVALEAVKQCIKNLKGGEE